MGIAAPGIRMPIAPVARRPRTPAPTATSARRRAAIRPSVYGAIAISPAPRSRAPRYCHAAADVSEPPSSTGTSPNATVPDRDAEEAAGEQQVERAPLDEEPNAGEHADERSHDDHCRVEDEPCVLQLVDGFERVAGGEQRRSRGEQADEEDLPQEPGAIALSACVIHGSLVGTARPADKSPVAERVLIVDDHPLTRDALSALLAQQGFDVVGEAEDGASAIAEAAALRPDIVLLDLTMPGMDGLTALPKIREQAPESEVVVLTASDTEENLLAAIRAGASGYLLKTEPPEQIAAFLRGVARGDAALSGGVARRLLDRVRDGGRLSGVPEEITRVLSAREVEVLLLLDEHLGTDEIAQRLFISEHTVRSHVKSLLKKLGVSSRREALERLDVARAA